MTFKASCRVHTVTPHSALNRKQGLWYPIGVALMTLIVGVLFLRDTKDVDIASGSGVEAQAKA